MTGLPSAIPDAGQSTRSGLEIRTSRTVPSGPGTSITAGLALTGRSYAAELTPSGSDVRVLPPTRSSVQNLPGTGCAPDGD
ncbi:hypothetical protein IDVR_12900 [Intrasporangium sp. DVR]